MKKRFSFGKRALALALSMVMCVGMLQVTAFAEDGTTTDISTNTTETGDANNGSSTTTTTTEEPITTSTGDANNGSSTTTTTTVETTVKTETSTKTPAENSVTTQGESVKTGSTTDSNVLEDKSETTVKDLSFEASGTIDLKGGSGSDTVSKEVTAESIAKELGWTCTDSKNAPELVDDNTVVSSETKVENKNGVYSVESTKTTTKTDYGEKKDVNSTVVSKKETTSEKVTPGIPTDPTPVGEPTEEVNLPERPTAGTTTNEDGTSTVVSVVDVTDDNGVTTGYTVTTQEFDAEGNVTSTRTENVSGTQKVEKTESVVEDKTTNTTTTETKTKVEEVLEDKVITTTETVRNEVAVCEDKNKLSANIGIDITDYANQGNIGDHKSEVVLGKQDVASADVALKQTTTAENGETKVSMDVAFTFEIQKGADPNKLFVTIYNRSNKNEKIEFGTVKIDTTDGKSGKVTIPDVNLTGLSTCDLVFNISYSDVSASGQGKDFYASLDINMVVDNIQTIGAAAKHTEAKKETEAVTTTNYEREDVTVETESVTTVTTTTTTKAVKTDTVNRSWSTETPTPGGTNNGGGGGTTGGDTPTPPVVVPDPEVPLVEEPVIDVPEEEVPLAEEPVVDIPDEEVPLAEEVVIPDDDVPLANVPKTGDISAMWYAVTLASACGLAILALRRKENG